MSIQAALTKISLNTNNYSQTKIDLKPVGTAIDSLITRLLKDGKLRLAQASGLRTDLQGVFEKIDQIDGVKSSRSAYKELNELYKRTIKPRTTTSYLG